MLGNFCSSTGMSAFVCGARLINLCIFSFTENCFHFIIIYYCSNSRLIHREEVQSQLVFELGTNFCRHSQTPASGPLSTSSNSPSSSPFPLPQTHFHSTHPSTPIARTSQPTLEIFRSFEIANIGNMRVNVDHVGLNGKSWCVL